MNVLLAVESSELRLALDMFLRQHPGSRVVGASCTTEGALALMRTVELHLVVLEWALPGLPTAELLAEARTLVPPPRFVLLVEEHADGVAAVAAGADAFAVIGDSPLHLLDAIRSQLPPLCESEREKKE